MTHIDPAEYALGLLDGPELAEARRREAEDPAFAAEVRALAQVGTRLDALEADEWDAAGPPPLRVDVAMPAAAAPRRSWLAELGDRLGAVVSARPALALGCVALVLGVGVGAGLLVAGGEDDGGPGAAPQVVALERFDDGPVGASGTAKVARLDGVREVTIDTRGLKPSAAGTSYEVWMIKDEKTMVGLGTFKVGEEGRATVTLPATVDPADYPVMDVSIEPDDGPSTHSGVSVLRSPAAPA